MRSPEKIKEIFRNISIKYDKINRSKKTETFDVIMPDYDDPECFYIIRLEIEKNNTDKSAFFSMNYR